MDAASITQLGTLEGLTSGGEVNVSSATSVNLGNIQNVKMAGGASNQVLVTDGGSNLSWNSLNSVSGVKFYSNVVNGVTGTNGTGAQSILGVGTTLTAGKVYELSANFNLYKTAGSTSHTLSFQWGGNATFTKILSNILVQQSTIGYVSYNAARSVNQYTMETTSPLVITTGITNTFYTVNIQISGIVSVSGTGTLIPQYALSAAPGGAYTVSPGSFIKLVPIADSASVVNVGSWA